MFRRRKEHKGACVWISLIKNLKVKHTKPGKLLQFIRSNNTLTKDITCNGQVLSDQIMNENYTAISNLSHVNYYDCSSCDPLLLLVCQLYNTSITHDYNGHQIVYLNQIYPNKMIHLSSNEEHMF